jgi:hypothetical protein
MGEGCALREARRPRRVLDVDRLVEVELGFAGAELVDGDSLAPREQLVPLVAEEDGTA